MHIAACSHSQKEQRKKDSKEKKTERDANEWPAGWMDSSVTRRIQIVTLLTNRIMKKTNLITVLKLWLITALGIGRTDKQTDRLQGESARCSITHTSVPLHSLCCFEGSGAEIRRFDVAQVDACDTHTARLSQQTAALSLFPRTRRKKAKICLFGAPEIT